MTISPTIDHSLMLALNGDLGVFVDNLMWYSSSKIATLPLVLFALYFVYKRGGFKQLFLAIVFLVLIIIFADQICNLFKHNLSRLRPTYEPMLEGLIHTVNGYRGGLYGTLSAHAANSVAVLGFCSLIISKRWYWILSIIFVFFICYSRIYLGVHYPLDILWGVLLGLFTAFSAFKIYSRKKINKKVQIF